MRINLKRTVAVAAALSVPMALGIGGVASAETASSPNTTEHVHSVSTVSLDTSVHVQGKAFSSHGNWYYQGWHNGRFFDRLNLTVLLDLGATDRNGYWDDGGLLIDYGHGGGLLRLSL